MAVFGSSLIRIDSRWTAFKTTLVTKRAVLQYDETPLIYEIFLLDNGVAWVTTIWKGTVPDSVTPDYSQEQNDIDLADFEANYKATGNGSIDTKTSDGRVVVASGKPDGTRTNFFSHDWTDPTSWYTQSVRVADEVATCSNAPTYTVFAVAHTNLIDSYHGKFTGEDFFVDTDNNSYRVVVKVNNVTKTEQDPHYGSGGDYTVDYAAGEITFLSALIDTDEVKVTYHYANGSRFVIKPTAGKRLIVEFAEVQFSTDVELNDTIRYQPFGYVDVFAPQMMEAPYNLPSGTMIPLTNAFVYKTMQDFLNDSVRAYPKYDPIGGDSWRGLQVASTIFDWDYTRSLFLSSAAGMEIRIWLEHDEPYGGTFATCSFYCSSVSE